MYEKNHKREFFRRADSYDTFSQIQKKVAKHLIKKIDTNPKKILDLGCGTGEILKNISWKYENFVGIDSSGAMCDLHPKSDSIKIICDDYESFDLHKKLLNDDTLFDIVVSSSSLQWAKNIGQIFNFCNKISSKVAFSIFTDGTFKTIYDITQKPIFLPNAIRTIEEAKKLWDIEYEVKSYKLYFEDNISKFRYIKKSGVSGGMKTLTYRQTKSLIKNYPLPYLEFEVLYIYSIFL